MPGSARRRLSESGAALRRIGAGAGMAVLNPGFVQRHRERTTRGGQILAAFLLIAMIPVSLIVVRVVNTMMVTFVLRGTDAHANTPFVVTFVTFVFLCMAGWFWFQWVRTAGFGMTNIGDGRP